jgi:dipeptide/tripeptide permease
LLTVRRLSSMLSMSTIGKDSQFCWTRFGSDIKRCVNIGGQAIVASTFLEKNIGFWVAFLICTCAIFLGLTLLYLGRKHYGETSYTSPSSVANLNTLQ